MAQWTENSMIHNFRNLRGGQFDTLRKELGITLSDEQLTACAVHCAFVLRREPIVGELLLWDRLAQEKPSAVNIPLNSLETKSAAIAETYADMMQKHRALSPVSASFSLRDALSLATNALERGGKERALKNHALRLIDRLASPFAANGIEEKNAPSFLSVFKKTARFPSDDAGLLCMLIDKGTLLPYAFERALFPVLENETLQKKLHGCFPVPQTGLLPALLSRFDGFTIDLSRLNALSLPKALTEDFAGDWVLVLSKTAVDEVLELLLANGISGTVFAQLTEKNQVTLLGQKTLTESVDFLRSLMLPQTDLAVTLQADAALTAPVSLQSCAGYPCRYLPLENCFDQTTSVLGATASAASAPLDEGAFSTAVLASLAPVLSCALSGVDYSEARFAVDLTLPKAGFDPSVTFAAAIGLYRVQAELGMPAADIRMEEAETNAPVLSVFALGKGIRIPGGKLTGADSKIYWLPVALSPDGLPDFAELRNLLADLSAQAKHGVIRSARVVLQQTPKSVLATMKSAELIAHPNRSARALREPVALGVLLESVYEMPFDCIATVAKRNVAQKPTETSAPMPDIPEQFQIPQGNGLIWRSAPEVVILAPKNKPDALALSVYLENLGASVTVFTLDQKEQFLRAVLTASVVYRFPGIRLPRDNKTKFAFSILKQNGGEVRCLKKAAHRSH